MRAAPCGSHRRQPAAWRRRRRGGPGRGRRPAPPQSPPHPALPSPPSPGRGRGGRGGEGGRREGTPTPLRYPAPLPLSLRALPRPPRRPSPAAAQPPAAGRERAPPPPRPFVLAPCRRGTPPLSSSGDTLRRTRACAPPGSDRCPRVCAPFDGPIDRPTMGGTHRSTSSIAYLSRPVMIDVAFPRMDPRVATPQENRGPPASAPSRGDRSIDAWLPGPFDLSARAGRRDAIVRSGKKKNGASTSSERSGIKALSDLLVYSREPHARRHVVESFSRLGSGRTLLGRVLLAGSVGGRLDRGGAQPLAAKAGVCATGAGMPRSDVARSWHARHRRLWMHSASPHARCAPQLAHEGKGGGPDRGARMGAAQGSAVSLNAGGG